MEGVGAAWLSSYLLTLLNSFFQPTEINPYNCRCEHVGGCGFHPVDEALRFAKGQWGGCGAERPVSACPPLPSLLWD